MWSVYHGVAWFKSYRWLSYGTLSSSSHWSLNSFTPTVITYSCKALVMNLYILLLEDSPNELLSTYIKYELCVWSWIWFLWVAIRAASALYNRLWNDPFMFVRVTLSHQVVMTVHWAVLQYFFFGTCINNALIIPIIGNDYWQHVLSTSPHSLLFSYEELRFITTIPSEHSCPQSNVIQEEARLHPRPEDTSTERNNIHTLHSIYCF